MHSAPSCVFPCTSRAPLQALQALAPHADQASTRATPTISHYHTQVHCSRPRSIMEWRPKHGPSAACMLSLSATHLQQLPQDEAGRGGHEAHAQQRPGQRRQRAAQRQRQVRQEARIERGRQRVHRAHHRLRACGAHAESARSRCALQAVGMRAARCDDPGTPDVHECSVEALPGDGDTALGGGRCTASLEAHVALLPVSTHEHPASKNQPW